MISARGAVAAGVVALAGFLVSKQVKGSGSQRRDDFDVLIHAAASRHSCVTFSLIKAVIHQESNFNPVAKAQTSSATGLMQVTVAVVTDYNNTFDTKLEHSLAMRNPRQNIEVGTWYLSQQVCRFGQFGGLRAYFAGPGGFQRGERARESLEYATQVSLKEVAILQEAKGQVA